MKLSCTFKFLFLSFVICSCQVREINEVQAQTPLQIAQSPVATKPNVNTNITSPYTLTSQEGVGLELVAFKAKAVIDGPLAFTQLEMTFKNPEDRTIEGRFKVVMPDQAAMSRFAMKINHQWMEGEIVEKQAARRAYEDALHRNQDPALLEQEAGNEFSARIFPIPAKSEKSIIISWSQERSNPNEDYRLPLIGLPLIKDLELTAQIAQPSQTGISSSLGAQQVQQYLTTTVKESNYVPSKDWVLNLDTQSQQATNALLASQGEVFRQDQYVLTRIRIDAEPKGQQKNIDQAVILFDTSASSLIDFDQKVEQLGQLIAGIQSQLEISKVEVILFDQETQSIFNGKPSDFGASHLQQIKDRKALGASHFEIALSAIQTQGDYRILLLSDGMFSIGETDRTALSKKLEALAPKGLKRVDAIVAHTARDKEMLTKLVRTKGLMAGKVILDASVEDQLKLLKKKIFDAIQVQIPGAKWTWPKNLEGVQQGDAVLVYAEVPTDLQNIQLELSGGFDQKYTPKIGTTPKALLERSWVQARIQKLISQMGEMEDRDLKEAMKKQIIDISTKYRVLSPYTAMVVLETEQDYARFNIQRNALSDILVVSANGVALEQRKDFVLLPPVEPVVQPQMIGDDFDRKIVKKSKARNGDTLNLEYRRSETTSARSAAPAPMAPPRMEAPGQAPAPTSASRAAADEAPKRMMMREMAEESRIIEESRIAEMKLDTEAEAAPEAKAEPTEALDDHEGDQASEKGGAKALEKNKNSDKDNDESAPTDTKVTARKQLTQEEFIQNMKGRSRPNHPNLNRRPQDPLIIIDPNAIQNINQDQVNALVGEFSEIDIAIRAKDFKKAHQISAEWRAKAPVDALSLMALGKIYLAEDQTQQAARAFGSLIDFFPSRADMIRLCANWLELVGSTQLELVLDMYLKALEQRPDHPVIYHLLSTTLAKLGRWSEAGSLLLLGLRANWPAERFNGVKEILSDDLSMIVHAWTQVQPKDEGLARLKTQMKDMHISKNLPKNTVRMILSWETDANDVDFHIHDVQKNHAFYSQKTLISGGQLYADITTGYGPESFVIVNPSAYPYELQAHYYRRGPMGYGGGKLQIISQDSNGALIFEERPFVIMVDGAYLNLGKVEKRSFK
jgi:tetratricopeptide (TPR) repeat protein